MTKITVKVEDENGVNTISYETDKEIDVAELDRYIKDWIGTRPNRKKR